MAENKGVIMPDCPLKVQLCLPCCNWWREGKCTYPKRDLRTEKELDDLKAMRDAYR